MSETILEIDRQFGASAPSWLYLFAEAPDEALEALLTGQVYLGRLNAEDPEVLLTDWALEFHDESSFAASLDSALSAGVTRHWGSVLPSGGKGTALFWQRLCDVAASVPYCRETRARLRDRWAESRRYLGQFSSSPSQDPLSSFRLAVAVDQPDDSLLDDWWRVVALVDSEMHHAGAVGVTGLRRIPGDNGGFRPDVVSAVIRYGEALAVRTRQGRLGKTLAKQLFLSSLSVQMSALPFRPKWRAALAKHARTAGPEVGGWLKPFASKPGTGNAAVKRSNVSIVSPRSDWGPRAEAIAAEIVAGASGAIQRAENLLEEQLSYARQTGDSYYLVRSSCNFASRAVGSGDRRAVVWALRATRWEPENEYTWTTLISACLALHDVQGALAASWAALEKHPYDSYVVEGAALALSASGEIGLVVEILREALDVVRHEGVLFYRLGDALSAMGDTAGALGVYETGTVLFPEKAQFWHKLGVTQERLGGNGIATLEKGLRLSENPFLLHCSLGRMYVRHGDFATAEMHYRSAIAQTPRSLYPRLLFGNLLQSEGRLSELVALYSEAAGLGLHHAQIDAVLGFSDEPRVVVPSVDPSTEKLTPARPAASSHREMELDDLLEHELARSIGQRLAIRLDSPQSPPSNSAPAGSQPEDGDGDGRVAMSGPDHAVGPSDDDVAAHLRDPARERGMRQKFARRARRRVAMSDAITPIDGISDVAGSEEEGDWVDSRLLVERVHQFIDAERFSEARAVVETAEFTHPASLGVRAARGRLERAWRAAEDPKFSEPAVEAMVEPWRHLSAQDGSLRLLEQLADLRACASLMDGRAWQDRTKASLGVVSRAVSSRSANEPSAIGLVKQKLSDMVSAVENDGVESLVEAVRDSTFVLDDWEQDLVASLSPVG